jgi:predicted tellurium resistance membrane protein TerC
MQDTYYQIAALLIAVSIAITLLIFIIRSIYRFMTAKPEIVVLLALIAITCSGISLIVPEEPKVYENLLVIFTSFFVLVFAGGIYNRNGG